jgi:NADPH:quinone reductase-like Zn-dependent oxidoreductase
MKAAVQESYGSVDVIRLTEVETPVPIADQILVSVRAASVNRADLDGLGPRPGFVRLFTGIRAPRSIRVGIDVAGVVAAVGPTATKFRVGDRVFADLYPFGSGAFAEFACAPERGFEAIGDDLSFEDAAALPHSAVLALQGLRWRDGRTPRTSDKVLIVGASGNVGPFAVQIAKSLGCAVTGVASSAKADFVRSLSLDHVIDYEHRDYTQAGDRYDWILDTDSHNSLFAVRRALKPGGVYITLGGNTGPILQAMLLGGVVSRASGKSMGLLWWWKPFHPPDVEAIKAMVADGRLRPAIDRTFPLEQVVDAMRYVDEGRARGKVLITVD